MQQATQTSIDSQEPKVLSGAVSLILRLDAGIGDSAEKRNVEINLALQLANWNIFTTQMRGYSIPAYPFFDPEGLRQGNYDIGRIKRAVLRAQQDAKAWPYHYV